MSSHRLRTVLLYFRTARHLRPRQVLARLWYRIAPTRTDLRPPPPVRLCPRSWIGDRWRRPALQDNGTAQFVGLERRITDAADWDAPDIPKLWRYNLHYHDDLVTEGARGRSEFLRAHVARWIVQNRPGAGTGWESYPTSLRIVNWIKASWSGDLDLDATARRSLSAQCRHLRTRIEWHLLGNHVWANAKAMIFAGTYFEGPEAERWRRYGVRLFEDQLDEQILSDGGHFERSPMYQAIMVEDMLDLVEITSCFTDVFDPAFRTRLSVVASKMLRWLRIMTHPDGGPAFFNDAAFGVAPELSVLEAFARRLGVAVDDSLFSRVEKLEASGYYRLSIGRAVVLCDVAALGPDYQPGHAHADTLSFEFSIDGHRTIVNGGTSTYELGPQRTCERGTAAHSTVQVDGADSSEMWSGFRVARRARAWRMEEGEDGTSVLLEGAHDGYRRLATPITHVRRWQLGPHGLEVRDRLIGGRRAARARFLVHPDVSLAQATDGTISLTLPSGGRVTARFEGGTANLRPGRWSPVFGATVPTSVIEADLVGPTLVTRFSW